MVDPQTMVGHWRLLSFVERQEDGSWADWQGAPAHGCISYWPNGRMQMMIGSPERPRLRGAWDQVPADLKARCLEGLTAYAGSWTVEGDRVRHHVDLCWIPNWEGRDLVRQVSFPAPGQVLLETVPDPVRRAQPHQRVLWERSA